MLEQQLCSNSENTGTSKEQHYPSLTCQGLLPIRATSYQQHGEHSFCLTPRSSACPFLPPSKQETAACYISDLRLTKWETANPPLLPQKKWALTSKRSKHCTHLLESVPTSCAVNGHSLIALSAQCVQLIYTSNIFQHSSACWEFQPIRYNLCKTSPDG